MRLYFILVIICEFLVGAWVIVIYRGISDETVEEVGRFVHERDWEKFHNPKDLAISINLEASELLELFQWSGTDTSVRDKLPELKEELADTLMYCIMMSLRLDINLDEIIKAKLAVNKLKYPKEQVYGSHKKYDE